MRADASGPKHAANLPQPVHGLIYVDMFDKMLTEHRIHTAGFNRVWGGLVVLEIKQLPL
jgi:hypothetical protein